MNLSMNWTNALFPVRVSTLKLQFIPQFVQEPEKWFLWMNSQFVWKIMDELIHLQCGWALSSDCCFSPVHTKGWWSTMVLVAFTEWPFAHSYSTVFPWVLIHHFTWSTGIALSIWVFFTWTLTPLRVLYQEKSLEFGQNIQRKITSSSDFQMFQESKGIQLYTA